MHLNQNRPALPPSNKMRSADAESDAESASDRRQDHRLQKKLSENIRRCGAYGHSQSDFLDSLRHGYKHDVHDSDAAHKKRNRRDGCQKNGHKP